MIYYTLHIFSIGNWVYHGYIYIDYIDNYIDIIGRLQVTRLIMNIYQIYYLVIGVVIGGILS